VQPDFSKLRQERHIPDAAGLPRRSHAKAGAFDFLWADVLQRCRAAGAARPIQTSRVETLALTPAICPGLAIRNFSETRSCGWLPLDSVNHRRRLEHVLCQIRWCHFFLE
jgi:hypothetical protein